MTVTDALRRALSGHLSSFSIESAIRRHLGGRSVPAHAINSSEREVIARKLEDAVALFSSTPRETLRGIVREALALDGGAAREAVRESVTIEAEMDVSVARNAARRIAGEAGMSPTKSIKIATSVSELARNIILYAGRGTLRLECDGSGSETRLTMIAEDSGPGIEPDRLDAIMSGRYASKTGLGKGILAVKRIADDFELESRLGEGTRIVAEFRGVA